MNGNGVATSINYTKRKSFWAIGVLVSEGLLMVGRETNYGGW